MDIVGAADGAETVNDVEHHRDNTSRSSTEREKEAKSNEENNGDEVERVKEVMMDIETDEEEKSCNEGNAATTTALSGDSH